MLGRVYVVSAYLLLAACVADDPRRPNLQGNGIGLLGDAGSTPLTTGRPQEAVSPSTAANSGSVGFTEMGKAPAASQDANAASQPGAASDGSKVTLNFVNADLQEFVRSVFDDVMKQSVIVDPTLTGKITVRTPEPMSKPTAMALVRQVLEMNGASLTQRDNVYRVSGSSSRRTGPNQLGGNFRIVPLTYIEAPQARSALQSFLSANVQVSANDQGRYLILSGEDGDLDNLQQIIATFDVDQMRGKSIALVPLKEANASAVATEVGQMFGDQNAKQIRIVPIQRMNALLVTSDIPQNLRRAKQWIALLDRADRGSSRVFVYPVQNRRAVELAGVLNGMFGKSSSAGAAPTEAVAPSFTPVHSQNSPSGGGALGSDLPSKPSVVEVPPNGSRGQSVSSTDPSSIEIRADPSTNSIIVAAKPEDYRKVESAIRSLDVQPSQVLIEVTIAEVTLNQTLNHGVQWFLQSKYGRLGLSNSSSGSTSPTNPGFNYTFGVANAQLVISALEDVTDVQIVSSPAITVLNNQTATLKVGDEVPIVTQSAQSVTTADAPVLNTIQLKDTGLIMNVTPRVNSSGLVMLDISQEDSEVVPTTTSNIDSPTIRQRSINSSVAVKSGTEIVLGGLISTNRQLDKQGLPILKDIPILGEAFTNSNSTTAARTELLMIIRPTVIANHQDVQSVTDEIKARMSGATGAIYR